MAAVESVAFGGAISSVALRLSGGRGTSMGLVLKYAGPIEFQTGDMVSIRAHGKPCLRTA
jgi:hypothetical protein